MVNVNFVAYDKTARTVAASAGLHLEVSQYCDCPSTDGKVIHMPPFPLVGTKQEQDAWWGSFYHEVGHNRPEYRGCFEVLKKVEDPVFQTVLNTLEDNRIEKHDDYHNLPGYRNYLNQHRDFYRDDVLASVGKTENIYEHLLEALMGLDYQEREEWMDIIPTADVFKNKMNAGAKEVYEKLLQGGILDKVRMTKTLSSEEVYNLAHEIMSVAEVTTTAPREAQNNKGGDSKNEGMGEEQEEKQAAAVKFADSRHSGEQFCTRNVEYRTGTGGVIPRGHDEHTFITGTTLSAMVLSQRYPEVPPVSVDGFSKSVSRVLQVVSKHRYSYGQTKGKLHNKNLYRVVSDTPMYNKVFKQKQDAVNLDVAVQVVMDCSGSMVNYSKYTHASHSLLLIQDSLSKLQISTELIGFTDDVAHDRFGLSSSGLTTYVFKDFLERVTVEEVRKRLNAATLRRGNNADGESLLFAYDRVVRRKEKRKIMIVLSDGMPRCRRGGDQEVFLKRVVKAIEDAGKVEIYGVGIKHDVSEYYTHSTRVNNPKTLEHKLLTLIKNYIIKGV